MGILLWGWPGSKLRGLMTTRGAELSLLVDAARVGKAAGAKDLEHLDAPAAAFNYIRIADLVSSYYENKRIAPPVLDWGCGYGQVSWLLRRRGVEVVSYDIEQRPARENLPLFGALHVEYGAEPTLLPYASSSFGAVLSVGVLEHVADIHASLEEVGRVLRSDGLFFVFMLPNRYSWAEWIADRRGVSVHPVKFTAQRALRMMGEHRFVVERHWRRNFLPRNLSGVNAKAKSVYGRFYRQIESCDTVLANWPPTSLFSGVLEMVATRR
jgi:SAM-dependent methyltransferase